MAAMLILALTLLILPLQWIVAMVLAAAVHELCHYGVARLLGGSVDRFRLGLWGAKMEIRGLTAGKELVCALAGPIGGLLLLPFARIIPRTALCAAAQSLYNLLPLYPLDGGRALRCLLQILLPPEPAWEVCRWIQTGCLIGIGILGCYGTFALGLGAIPLLVSCLVIVRAIRENDPCKPGACPLQ